MGLVARQLEAAGVPTITLTSAWSITASVNPPRAAFADLPLGHTAGGPGDRTGQRHIVQGALEAAVAMTTAGTIADLGVRWVDEAWKDDPLAWRRRPAGRPASAGHRRASGAAAPTGPADTRRPRSPEPQYQCEEDRRLARRRTVAEQCAVCFGLDPPG